MLPKVLSALGLALIVLALLGFALPLSTAPRGRTAEVSVLAGGDMGNPPDTHINGNVIHAIDSNGDSNVSANANGPLNVNGRVTPTPPSTPPPPPTPPPTPRPTATPVPKSFSDDEVVSERASVNLERAGLKLVKVEVRDGVASLVGEVEADRLDEAVAAARAAGARKVDTSRLRITGRRKPDPLTTPEERQRRREGMGKPPGDTVISARPEHAPAAALLLEVQAEAPEQSRIEVEWPGRLDMKGTGTVRVSIVNESGGPAPPAADIPGSSVSQLPLPEGCVPAGKSLRNAYGPQYEAHASAKLTAASADFDVQPGGDEQQPLNTSRATWTWLIKPRAAGSHNVTVSAIAEWRPKQPKSPAKPSCRILNRSFPVYVEDSWYNEGNLKTAQTVVGLVGLVLQLPIFVWARKKTKGGDEDEEKGGGEDSGGEDDATGGRGRNRPKDGKGRGGRRR